MPMSSSKAGDEGLGLGKRLLRDTGYVSVQLRMRLRPLFGRGVSEHIIGVQTIVTPAPSLTLALTLTLTLTLTMTLILTLMYP